MYKRGLSGVVTVVLIILLVIVSVSIVWLFVQPAIVDIIGGGDDPGEFDKFAECLDLSLEIDSCTYQNGVYTIDVLRRDSGKPIEELAFKFRSGQKSVVVKQDSNLGGFSSERFVFDLSEYEGDARSVEVAGILDVGACDYSAIGSCTGTNVEELGCSGLGLDVINLDDFDPDLCSRTRAGLLDAEVRKIPSVGFHSIGAYALQDSANIGTKFHRAIVSWNDTLDVNGNYKPGLISASAISSYLQRDVKLVITLRPNHPEKSECYYDVDRGIDEKDSYPKDEEEWKSMVRNFVDEYYVQPILDGEEPILAGIQIGNEWGHQYAINTTQTPDCVNDRELQADEIKSSMVAMTRITREAMDDAQIVIPGEKRLPLITFGITGADSFAMRAGFYNEERGVIYNGFLDNGVEEKAPGDITGNIIPDSIEEFIIEAALYYDYVDIHQRTNFYDEHGYIASWIRDLWDQEGITGKGLMATEYAGPFHFYTTDYHEYFIPVSLANSFLFGYDAIAWAPWTPPKKLRINFGLMGMIDWDGNPRQYAQDGYQEFTSSSGDFDEIRLNGDYEYQFFDQSVMVGSVVVNPDFDIPGTYNQCQDGLDNDNDGLDDGLDPGCGDGVYTNDGGVDVEYDGSGIYF